jgi:hypothetical protein
MDITVTRTVGRPRTWTLADLLGRPIGLITEDREGGFMIDADGRAPLAMLEMRPGPYTSLDAAMNAIEKQMRGACRLASDQEQGRS